MLQTCFDCFGFTMQWHASRKVCLQEKNSSEAEHLTEAARQAAQDAHLRAQEALANQLDSVGADVENTRTDVAEVRNSPSIWMLLEL